MPRNCGAFYFLFSFLTGILIGVRSKSLFITKINKTTEDPSAKTAKSKTFIKNLWLIAINLIGWLAKNI